MAIIYYNPKLKSPDFEESTKVQKNILIIKSFIKDQIKKEGYTIRSFGVTPETGLVLMVVWGGLFIIPGVINDIRRAHNDKIKAEEAAEKEYLKNKLEESKLKLEALDMQKKILDFENDFIIKENQDIKGLF